MSRRDDLNKLGRWGRKPASGRPATSTRTPPNSERPKSTTKPRRPLREPPPRPESLRGPREQGAMDRAGSGPRKKLLSVTLTDSERGEVRAAAENDGLTCSSWARRVLLAAARRR